MILTYLPTSQTMKTLRIMRPPNNSKTPGETSLSELPKTSQTSFQISAVARSIESEYERKYAGKFCPAASFALPVARLFKTNRQNNAGIKLFTSNKNPRK